MKIILHVTLSLIFTLSSFSNPLTTKGNGKVDSLESITTTSKKQLNFSGHSLKSKEGLSVKRNKILLNGAPFYPRGYVFASFLNKRENLMKYASHPEYKDYCLRSIEAQNFYFGDGKYAKKPGVDLAKKWGANTLRFNLNQACLDPDNEYFSTEYIELIKRVVKTAKDKDYVVILSLFCHSNDNIPKPMQLENPKMPINNKTSLGAALMLTKLFGKDPYIMLELLNEPYSPGKIDFGWQLYLNGGYATTGRYKTIKFVGVNTIINAMRKNGAKNIIIIQGLDASFSNYPGGIKDPLNRHVFSVHPFFGDGTNPKKLDWERNFGNFAKKKPFLITAWGAKSKDGWCRTYGMNQPKLFLDYLKKKNIGIMAFALDVPWTAISDFRVDPIKPTSFGDNCSSKAEEGAGKLLMDYFISFENNGNQ